jgi:molybdate transport system ATP-binding protein
MASGLSADFALCRGRFAFKVQFELEPGVTGVFGPSGAGKSTLLGAVAGTVVPDHGSISFNGRALFDTAAAVEVAPQERGVGYAFQSGRLFPHLSVSDNVYFGRRLRPKAAAFDADQVIESLELNPLMDRRIAKLSGGEARRVGLARAFLAAERLLLLDEPLSGLDDRLGTQVLGLLRRARDEQALSMLYVSHSMWEIQELSNQVLILDDGSVLGCGEMFDVLRDPRVFALANRLGLDNLLCVEVVENDSERSVTLGRVGDRELVLPLGDHPAGTTARVSIRPSDILLARESVTGTSARNCVRGVVESIVEVGDRILVNVDIGQPVRVEVTRAAAAELDIELRAEVYLLLKTYAFTWRPG